MRKRLRSRLRTSLKMKWAAMMLLLVTVVLMFVGIFLLETTAHYYINQFRSQVGAVFTTDFLDELNGSSTGSQAEAVTSISAAMDAYSAPLGVGSGREYYIMDAQSGECLAASELAFDGTAPVTANIVTAMNGEVGEKISLFGRKMDIAIPITGEQRLVVQITDDRSDMRHMCWLMFITILAGLFIGLAVTAVLSMVLIRTVTDPIEQLNRGAKGFANGEYDQRLQVYDPDELGQLTASFNAMGAEMNRAMTVVQLERVRMQLLGDCLSEGLVTCSPEGIIQSMNQAAERLLGCSFESNLPFAAVFGDMPIPDAEQGAVRVRLNAQGRLLDAVFAADENRGFTAVIVPAEVGIV